MWASICGDGWANEKEGEVAKGKSTTTRTPSAEAPRLPGMRFLAGGVVVRAVLVLFLLLFPTVVFVVVLQTNAACCCRCGFCCCFLLLTVCDLL